MGFLLVPPSEGAFGQSETVNCPHCVANLSIGGSNQRGEQVTEEDPINST